MRASIIVVVVLLFGCKSDPKSKGLFTLGKELGEIQKDLEEASGLASSVNNPGHFWSLNDNGNSPEVFLIDEKAKISLVCKLPNIRNRDWEDIAVGAGPIAGKSYVYVADIGDNDAQYNYKYIYRFEEPVAAAEKKITITDYDTLILKMPDGNRDTETILLDPVSHDLYLVSKRENKVGLYRSPWPFVHDTTVLQKAATLHLTSIVAGGISPDGQEVLLKNYGHIYYWKKTGEENLVELLLKDPVLLDYEREPQGESIAWSLDGNSFYTLSESPGKKASLLEYKRR